MTPPQIHVGDLHCQRDPYCREFQTTCIDCSEKPDKKGFYAVKLHDTILFPEGGGQPFDTGFIDDAQVYNVQREKLEHIHYTKSPVPVGKQVTVKLDWERRWDYMQQHSGQHVLSTVLKREPYCVDTGAWNLGESKCYIELETGEKKQKMPSAEQLKQVEQRVNQIIVDALPIVVHTEAYDDAIKPDTLPADYVGGGTIRYVGVQDMDLEACCGTPVKHTGHLQSIKLLYTEKPAAETHVFSSSSVNVSPPHSMLRFRSLVNSTISYQFLKKNLSRKFQDFNNPIVRIKSRLNDL